MEHKINEIVHHLSHSQQQMARILEAQRHAAVRMAQIIHAMPDSMVPRVSDTEKSGLHIEQVNGSIASYLNAMADFQQTAADHLEIVMKELRGGENEE
ncbi:nucleoside-diphosphate sugar epimerase [Paenibacillus lemnae]|uniref:Nucleoside-diphosphate sugar epimerase n=1 Tax=Paenibacillus lemnae TaxID=1330551 RepID=A0A848M5Z2_PAELE|nr:nucleoside-diphosphate sugar epimerase [Paenibacillus lemnae]NMO95233.1 nucleoside-diphosphate sugar epimerase [Paenibacillus lemnae]